MKRPVRLPHGSPLKSWNPELGIGRASRPGFGCDAHMPPPAEVARWIASVKQLGVRSVVSLLSATEMGFYAHLPSGLLGAYHSAGLKAASLPINPDEPTPMSRDELAILDEILLQLPRPIVIHCNAGQVRSRQAVDHVVRQARRNRPDPTPARDAEILELIRGTTMKHGLEHCPMKTGQHGMADYGRLSHLLREVPLAHLNRYLGEIDEIRATTEACVPCSLKLLAFCMRFSKDRLPTRNDDYGLEFRRQRRRYPGDRDFHAEVRKACAQESPKVPASPT